MNANELAKKSFMELWDSYTSKKMECEDLHEKICQQQAEIKTLEGALAQLKHMNKNWAISEGWLLTEIDKLKDLLEAYRDDNRTSESFDRTASHMAGEYVAHPVELTQYDRGFDDGCKHTKKIYEAEIEALKAKLTYAKDTIESIVWTDRKPFDKSGWASVSFSALAKGADFLRKIQDQ